MSEKPKDKPVSRFATVLNLVKRGIAGIVIFTFFGLVLGICSIITISMLFTFWRIPHMGWIAEYQIEEFMQFQLPLHRQNVRFYQFRTDHDATYRFKFTAPPDEITEWLEHPNLCFETPFTDDIYEHGWHFYFDWWDSSSVTTVVTNWCRTDGNHINRDSQSILIDQTNADYWTVYFIVWYR